jgi:hypothetical protein
MSTKIGFAKFTMSKIHLHLPNHGAERSFHRTLRIGCSFLLRRPFAF